MKIAVSDSVIERAARSLTPNPECRVMLSENGHYLYEDDGKTRKICQGRLSIVRSGKVVMIGTCNEPCSFVCDTSRVFQQNVQIVRAVITAINEANAGGSNAA